MPYDAPLYERGTTVYLRESASVGFLEAHTIAGVTRGNNGWVYTILIRPNLPTHAPHYGERRSLTNGAIITFEECEFIQICDALALAEQYHQNQLAAIQNRIATHCVDPTSGTSGTSGS